MFCGALLEQLMKERNFTAYRLSKILGCSQSSIANWISGKNVPNYENISALADALNVSVDYLLGNEGTHVAGENDDELNEMLEDVRRNPELRAMFSITKKATPEQVRQYIKVIKALRGGDDDE